jgi:hypothetical protein
VADGKKAVFVSQIVYAANISLIVRLISLNRKKRTNVGVLQIAMMTVQTMLMMMNDEVDKNE